MKPWQTRAIFLFSLSIGAIQNPYAYYVIHSLHLNIMGNLCSYTCINSCQMNDCFTKPVLNVIVPFHQAVKFIVFLRVRPVPSSFSLILIVYKDSLQWPSLKWEFMILQNEYRVGHLKQELCYWLFFSLEYLRCFSYILNLHSFQVIRWNTTDEWSLA